MGALSSRSLPNGPVVAAEINRRITGDPASTPAAYFARRYCRRRRDRTLMLGGDQGLRRELLALGACGAIIERDAYVVDRLPADSFDLALLAGVVGQSGGLNQLIDELPAALRPDGLLYVDQFVGCPAPSRADHQRDLATRLLGKASISETGQATREPSESDARGELLEILSTRFEPIEQCLWEGSFFGYLDVVKPGLDGDTDLARVMIEAVAILSEESLVDRDFLWGVYRLRDRGRRRRRRDPQTELPERCEGRLEAVEGGAAVGWALDASDPEQRLAVDLYIDHRLVASTVADLPRSDLARETVGDGAHAFRIELPTWLSDGRAHSISAFVPALRATLRAARGFAVNSATAPNRTTFAPARHDPAIPPLPAARVLAGDGGWAFGCDDAVGTLEQLLGRLTLTEAGIERWRSFLADNAAETAQHGIPYIVAVAPAKGHIHPERLPVSSPVFAPAPTARRLVEALGDASYAVIDITSELRQAAATGESVFFMRDSGWNARGAQIAGRALLGAVTAVAGLKTDVDLDHLAWSEQLFEGDLAGVPSAVLKGGLLHRSGPTPPSERTQAPVERDLGLRPTPPPARLGRRDPSATAVGRVTGAGGDSALIVHDPVGRRLLPFLAPAFDRSVWTTTRVVTGEMIRAFAPSVVLQLLDEPQLVRTPHECYW